MKYVKWLSGIFVGMLNTLLGAGGGMLVVPTLKAGGLTQQEAQATAIAVICPLTIVSAIIYLMNNSFAIQDTFIYIPFGIVGSIFGAKLLPKISGKYLSVIFGVFLIISSIRMFFK